MLHHSSLSLSLSLSLCLCLSFPVARIRQKNGIPDCLKESRQVPIHIHAGAWDLVLRGAQTIDAVAVLYVRVNAVSSRKMRTMCAAAQQHVLSRIHIESFYLYTQSVIE